MFGVRLIVLLFLSYYSWGMSLLPTQELNAFGHFISFSILIWLPLLYMLPTYEAWKNKQPDLTSIALVNLFLGWSLLGWVAALVWAFKKSAPVIVSPSQEEGVARALQPVRETKMCVFCAEEILAAAIKCKHCGSDVRGSV